MQAVKAVRYIIAKSVRDVTEGTARNVTIVAVGGKDIETDTTLNKITRQQRRQDASASCAVLLPAATMSIIWISFLQRVVLLSYGCVLVRVCVV